MRLLRSRQALAGGVVTHITIYPGQGWFGPDDRARLEPWGFRFGPVNTYGNAPILPEKLALTLASLEDWDALLRALRYVAIVTGRIDSYGDHVFTIVLNEAPQPSSAAHEAHASGE